MGCIMCGSRTGTLHDGGCAICGAGRAYNDAAEQIDRAVDEAIATERARIIAAIMKDSERGFFDSMSVIDMLNHVMCIVEDK